MQNHKVYSIAGCVLTLTAVAAQYGISKLAVPHPHLLPVQTFPVKVGAWTGGELVPEDGDLKKRLPTANIMERVYTNLADDHVDLTLVTATDAEDIHSPLACFPSQGWTISKPRTEDVDGTPVQIMDAQQDTSKYLVLYWYAGYYAPPPPSSGLVKGLSDLRTRLIGLHEGESMFVRTMIPEDDAASLKVIKSFAGTIIPSIDVLAQAGKSQTVSSQ